MSDVIEVRPGTLTSEALDAVVRALGGAGLVGPDGQVVELPERIQSVLVSIVENLRSGNGVSVIPLHAELTTVQAAELLNVSRPHLVKQVEAGEVPHHMVGTHRRLKLVDVLAYRDRLQAQANEALDAMTAEAEDLGLYQ
ncbi:MAG: helix-turn-helix domain-containing protein [Acidimicrobiales bacterium]